jgi:hypothetical protein
MKIIACIFSTLSLEAHEIGTGDARISLWETDYRSYDRDLSRSKKILVTLHNLSRKPAPFAVTVYFIAKPTIAPGAQATIRALYSFTIAASMLATSTMN